MAQHVQDSAVVERRLRPIYDSLEIGNNKKALQEAEKVLKKNPSLQCARALKALALLRLGREDESESIIGTLSNENITDESTLQVMTFCYRETDQLDKICALYGNAAKLNPSNEELLSHLFMAHVRINDYKSQQTVALQLYKLKPKNPYYFWAVMSVVLQALRGPDSNNPDKSKLLLALAQRMVDKLIAEDKLDAEQEVQLYIIILQHQGKYREALEFMEGPIGMKLYPGAPVSLKLDLLKNMNRWGEVNILLKQLLQENLDRWDYYKEYITSCFTLQQMNDKSEGADVNAEMCHEFLCQLIENGNKVRGPYLARLELHRLLRQNGTDPIELLGDYLELLVEYFRLFGDKSCCANDIKMFLEYLEPYKRPGFASKILHDCGITSTTLPQNKEQMQKHICALKISRYIGAHNLLGTEHSAALYTAFSLHYEHGMTAFGINLLPTDIGPSDPYALLAVNLMYDLSLKSNSSERLTEALCLLHYLLTNSPSNFHAKLLCLQIYHILGCGWGAAKIYESLDIKHVQLDSMGYLHCALLPALGIPSISKPLYDATLKFFTSSYKDSVEYLSMSYKFGSFSKLQEFMDFRERLSNSLHHSLISVEALLLEMVCFSGTFSQNLFAYKNMSIHPAEDRIHWNDLADNRDLSVVIRWDSPQEDFYNEDGTIKDINLINSPKEISKENFIQDTELLQIRASLLRLVASCIDLLTNTDKAKELMKYETLDQLCNNWNEIFLRIRQMNYRPTSNDYLVNLLPSRLHSALKMPYEIVFKHVGNFVWCICKGNEDPKLLTDYLMEDFKQVTEILTSKISKYNEEKDLIWGRREVQEVIVSCIEILSLCSFIILCCYERFTSIIKSSQVSVGGGKKNKKKDIQQNITNHQNHTIISDKDRLVAIGEVLKCLKEQLTTCDLALDKWKNPDVSAKLLDSLAALSLTPKVEVVVNGIFKENHRLSVKELKNIVKEKIKMVNK